MDKETLRMQMLSGIITESEYKAKLEENAASNLELKSLAKQLYLGFKKLGAAPKLLTTKMEIGKKGSWEDGVNITIFSGEDTISVNINSKGIGVPKAEGIKNNIEKSFPKAIFTPVNGGKDWEGNPIISFNITPGKDMSESLNESMIGGIVGIGAINQIPSRVKADYEDAFEYFLSQKYSLNEMEDLEEYAETQPIDVPQGMSDLPKNVKDDPQFKKLVDYFKTHKSEAKKVINNVEDELSSLKEAYKDKDKYYIEDAYGREKEATKKEYLRDKLLAIGLPAAALGLVGALMAGPLGAMDPGSILQAIGIAAGIGGAAGAALDYGKPTSIKETEVEESDKDEDPLKNISDEKKAEYLEYMTGMSYQNAIIAIRSGAKV